jgi:hypothetical protein
MWYRNTKNRYGLLTALGYKVDLGIRTAQQRKETAGCSGGKSEDHVDNNKKRCYERMRERERFGKDVETNERENGQVSCHENRYGGYFGKTKSSSAVILARTHKGYRPWQASHCRSYAVLVARPKL